jgi:hypothetical protein
MPFADHPEFEVDPKPAQVVFTFDVALDASSRILESYSTVPEDVDDVRKQPGYV